MMELKPMGTTLQDRLKQIFDDAGGSDTLVDLLREFDFEGSRDLADAIVLGMARPEPAGSEPVAYLHRGEHDSQVAIYTKIDPTLTQGRDPWTVTPLYAHPTDARAEVEREVVAWLRATWMEDDAACIWDEIAGPIERGEYRHD